MQMPQRNEQASISIMKSKNPEQRQKLNDFQVFTLGRDYLGGFSVVEKLVSYPVTVTINNQVRQIAQASFDHRRVMRTWSHSCNPKLN